LFSTEELELATAKALDRTVENPNDRGMRLKLLVLSASMKRRSNGQKVSAFKRFWLLADPMRITESFFAEQFPLSESLDEEILRRIAQSE